jgi:RNA polymerase sigma factor (sigma-70 family)
VGCTTVLNSTQERNLFYQFNYGRYRVLRLLRAHRGRRLGKRATGELLRWDRFAMESRAAIVRANTSLVGAMASRYPSRGVESGELISEGNLVLLRCVDKFDCSRGFKFSTYVCRAILESFWRVTRSAVRYRHHHQTGVFAPGSDADRMDRLREGVQLEELDELRQILDQNTADLSAVEQRVLDARFSLRLLGASTAVQPRTLDQVGIMLGVSKEWARQLQNQAIRKLRTVLEQRFAEAS